LSVNFTGEERDDGAKLLWNMLSDLVNFQHGSTAEISYDPDALAAKLEYSDSVASSITVVVRVDFKITSFSRLTGNFGLYRI